MLSKALLQAYRARLGTRSVLYGWLIASATLTLTGPFGTYEGLPFGQRCFYWTTVVGISLIIGYAVEVWVQHTFGDLSPWSETLATGTLLTLTFTPFLYAFTLYMTSGSDKVLAPHLMAFVVFSVPVIHRALVQLVFIRKVTEAAPPVEETEEPRARLLRRVPDAQAREVAHVSVRDHYVDVYTDRGKHSLLMRFSDAIAELEGVAGLQVHRSHWVALEAVDHIERTGSRIYLRLRDGSAVPVSRANWCAVETALAHVPMRSPASAEREPDHRPEPPVRPAP